MSKTISRRSVLQSGIAATLASALPPIAFADDLDYIPAVPGRPNSPTSDFVKTSTAEEVTAGMDLSGMTALVTGCNSGLGLETMRVLALRGAHVIGAARTLTKAENACASVDGKTTPLVVELTDWPGIVDAGNQVAEMGVPIDMLILNAGIMALPDLHQAHGIELQFAVNHLGHFLLENRLHDQVVAAKAGRVVVVSSGAHRWAPAEGIQFDNLSGDKGYDPRQAYGQSKVANGLFSRELARRLADTSATSNSLHPGVIPTNLSRYQPDREYDMSNPRFKTIPQGAATQCYVATSPILDGVTGYYFDNCNPAVPSEHMQDDQIAAKLWEVSAELVADYL
ncbi:MAG: SDR family NAD(P)-dependent oxidoreductase [Gammaproteobacteria bacterium]|nr:SDR family NAD(P)-dependent oxidoreductase [Gammaproteobacteria bacterium]